MGKSVICFSVEVMNTHGSNKIEEIEAKNLDRLMKSMPKWMKKKWVKIDWYEEGEPKTISNK
jgi:hypothetical protein